MKSFVRIGSVAADYCCLYKGFQFGQDGGEKFCNRRMNMHGTLHYCIRRLCIHDVQQGVNDFIASGPKNRSTQNVLCFRINRDFDEPLRLTFLNSPAHSAHRMFRSECRPPGPPYFGVRHAASAQRRICKQSVRLDSIGHAAMACVEQIIGDALIVVV